MTHTLLRRPLGPRGVRVAVAGAVAVVRDGGSCVVREQGPELRREHDRVLRLRSETKRRRRRLRGVTPSAPTDRAPSPEISRRFFVRFRVAGGPRGVGTTCHPLSPEERSREPGDHAGTNDTDRCPMGRLDPEELALADLAYQDTRWQLRTADPARKDELLRALVHLVQTDPAAFGVLAAYRKLWRRWDSNPRPPACKAGALAN
jgi:hypothetical protein